MDRQQLFTGEPSPVELVRNPEESPSPLASYTLTEMVGDLAEVSEGYVAPEDGQEDSVEVADAMRERYAELQAKHEAVLDAAEEHIVSNDDTDAARVTQLDLVFMLGAYLPHSERPGIKSFDFVPEKLTGLLNLQSERFGLSPFMDYDLVIDANSEEYLNRGHIRTFTGETGERDFYIGHHLSEPHVRAVADDVRTLIDNPQTVDPNELLSRAAANMKEFRTYMQKYIKLSTGTFGRVRPYLMSYPDGTRNASGAFMAGVPLAELALRPETTEQGKFLDEAMPYYPRNIQNRIAQWREDSKGGHNLMDALATGRVNLSATGEEAKAALVKLTDEFVGFRMAHHAATRKQIPGAFPPGTAVSRTALRAYGEPDIMGEGVKGTANFDLQALLGGTVNRTIVTLDEAERL